MLLGALGWNLERCPISNEGEKHIYIYWDLWHLNGGGYWP